MFVPSKVFQPSLICTYKPGATLKATASLIISIRLVGKAKQTSLVVHSVSDKRVSHGHQFDSLPSVQKNLKLICFFYIIIGRKWSDFNRRVNVQDEKVVMEIEDKNALKIYR